MHASADLGPAFLDVLLRASWQATVLTGVVLVLQRLLRRWLTPAWRHALWLIVMARLLLPVAPASSWSLFNVAPTPPIRLTAAPPLATREPAPTKPDIPPADVYTSPMHAVSTPDPRRILPSFSGSGPATPSPLPPAPFGPLAVAPSAAGASARVPAGAAPPANARFSSWPGLVLVLWTLGVVALSGRLSWNWYRFRRELRSARPIEAAGCQALLSECRQRLAVGGDLRAFEADWVYSPALYGWWRPRLLLPAGLTQRLSGDELRHVLLHEFAHLKRRDILLNWMASAAQVLHWFNPVVWFTLRRLRAERELAADHLALVTLGEDATQSYGQTILKLMAGCARPVAVPAVVGILEDRGALRERIQAIAAFRRPGPWTGLAAVVVAALAIVGLTNATEDHHDTASPDGRVEGPTDATNPTADPVDSREDFLWGTLTINSQPLTNMPVRLHYRHKREGVNAALDAQGVLRLPRELCENLVVVSCAEGVADVVPETLANGFHYELKPAGRLEGELQFDGTPAASVKLGLIAVPFGAQRTHAELLETLTDGSGHFVFATVPPGRWRVERWISLPENPAWAATRRGSGPRAISSWIGGLEGIVEVQARKTSRVELGRDTRTLTGRVAAEEVHPNLDWNTFRFGLGLPMFPDTNTQAGRELARRVEAELESSGRARRNYHPEFEPDGRFTVRGVAPGDYELMLIFRGAPAAGPAADLQIVGTAGGVVKVPAAEVGVEVRSHDLGVFALQPVRRLRIGDPGVPFQGDGVKGEDVRFYPGGGEPALLYFWPGGNHFELSALKRVIEPEGMADFLRVLVLVTMEELAEAKRHWAYANTGWPLVMLADERAVKEAYEIQALPALILLDAEGKVVTRQWEAEALTPFLRAMAGNHAGPDSPASEARLWGTVFLDGHPLEGAFVTYHGRLRRLLGGQGLTDARGRIFVYPNPVAEKLVVWHDPFQAVLDASSLTQEFRVELGSARGAVMGTLWRGDQPWPGKALNLERRWPGETAFLRPPDRRTRGLQIPATTDARGRFEFRDVPCGVWVVRSRYVEWGEFPVRPGEVVAGDVGRTGVAIVGEAVAGDPALKADWRNARVNLITDVGGLRRWLPGEVEADGSFVVPEVPPGEHELTIRVLSGLVVRSNQFPVELGASPRLRVSVPTNPVAGPTALKLNVGRVPLRMESDRESDAAKAAPRYRALELPPTYISRFDVLQPGASWSSVPKAHRTLDGVPFDLIGVLGLDGLGALRAGTWLPTHVGPLLVGGPVGTVHVLCGTAAEPPERTRLGWIVLLYDHGASCDVALDAVVSTRNWWVETAEPPGASGDPVARAAEPRSSAEAEPPGVKVSVFHARLANPRPDQPVRGVDIVLRPTDGTPAILAVTVKAPDLPAGPNLE